MLNIRFLLAILVVLVVCSTVSLAAPNRILMRFGKRAVGGIPVHLGGEYVPVDYIGLPYGPDNDF